MTQEPHPYGEIYVVTCLVNGKQYVGQTTRGVGVRWQGHIKRSCERVSLLTRSIAKHGVSQFHVRVLDTADSQVDLDAREIQWIAALGTLSPNGYNLTAGGKGGKMSPEACENNRRAQLGKKRSPESIEKFRTAVTGRKQTLEHVEKVRLFHTGRKRSDETRAKMSAVAKARGGGSKESLEAMRQANVGRTMSPEIRARMSAFMTGLKRSPEARENMRRAKATMTPETRAKISEAARKRVGEKRSPEARERMRVAAIEAHRVRREKKEHIL